MLQLLNNFTFLFFFLDIPASWQIFFQDPATQIMESLIDFHHDLMFYLVFILVFVVLMLVQITYYYKATDSYVKYSPWWSHHTALEIWWTSVPIYILLIIGGPSFSLLYSIEELIYPRLTIRAIGRQWYWHYEYGDLLTMSVDGQNVEKAIPKKFDSYLVPDSDSRLRLLDVTEEMYVPAKIQVRLLTTASDVLHSWTIPSLGLKLDACPGRLNQTAILVKRMGLFYGQCSEICGVNHGFMPIGLRAVSIQEFNDWRLSK